MVIYIVVSLLLSILSITALVNASKPATQPVVKQKVWVYAKELEPGAVLKRQDLDQIEYPQSIIPKGIVTDLEEVVGKRLIHSVQKLELAMKDQTVDRGDKMVDQQEFWEIGIDVKNISNYLGAQLKVGEDYILIHRSEDTPSIPINVVKVLSLVDTAGRLIINEDNQTLKTINIGVKDEAGIIEISDLKKLGEFELVDPPEGYVFTKPALPEEEEGANELDQREDE